LSTFAIGPSAVARLAAGRINAHSAARRSNFATVKFASFLSLVGVCEIDKGCTLRFPLVVSQYTDSLWLQVILAKYLLDVHLADLSKAANEHRVLLVTLRRSAATVATTAISSTATVSSMAATVATTTLVSTAVRLVAASASVAAAVGATSATVITTASVGILAIATTARSAVVSSVVHATIVAVTASTVAWLRAAHDTVIFLQLG